MPTPTTLFALLTAGNRFEIEGCKVGYVEDMPDGTVRIHWFEGGDCTARFADQTVSFDDGCCNARSCADPEANQSGDPDDDDDGDCLYSLTFWIHRHVQPEDLK